MDRILPRRPTSRDDFEIAIICALLQEYDAVAAVLDGYWNDDRDLFGRVEGDQNTYTTGWIGSHNVVLALLSDMGKVNATSVATSFKLSYRQIKLAFLVGICGAVPKTDDSEITLGDVIVSHQVVEYDLGRRYPDKLRTKSTLEGSSGQQNHNTRRYIMTMQTDHYRERLTKRAVKHLRVAQEKRPDKYGSLPVGEDRLFQPDYRHKHQISASCDVCNACVTESHPVCTTALKSTCDELGCDVNKLVHRKRLKPHDRDQEPMIHFGKIGSGDSVMKSAVHRDDLAKTHDIIAFEMEAAGILGTFPGVIIVKGVCDYADSHKNKKWQRYAAITAACVMHTLLDWYPQADQLSRPVLMPSQQELLSILQGRDTSMPEFHVGKINDYIFNIQQQNNELQTLIHQLRAQMQYQRELPQQVPSRDLVVVNDALGATYSFPLTFVDSLELFVTILKHKFQHVGVAKIERGEWMLENHCTGQILDLSRPWKAVVKPGQILDMSMIFRKRIMLQCPWCNRENPYDNDNQPIECQTCSRKYQRVEEVYDISMKGSTSQKQDREDGGISSAGTVQARSPPSRPQPPPTPRIDDSEDIDLYTRVRIINFNFRVAQRLSVNDKTREYLIILRNQDLKDIKSFLQYLAENHHLSEQDCLAALKDHYADLIASKKAAGSLPVEDILFTVLNGSRLLHQIFRDKGGESQSNESFLIDLSDRVFNMQRLDKSKASQKRNRPTSFAESESRSQKRPFLSNERRPVWIPSESLSGRAASEEPVFPPSEADVWSGLDLPKPRIPDVVHEPQPLVQQGVTQSQFQKTVLGQQFQSGWNDVLMQMLQLQKMAETMTR